MFAWSRLIGTAFAESPPWPYFWDRQPSTPLGQSWDLGRFTTLVAFGDSYTDDNRFNYFDAHNYTPPPIGWAGSAQDYDTSNSRRLWAAYVKQYTGANLYNYAVNGAECSDEITPRTAAPWFNFPTVKEYEIPAYIADSEYTEPNGKQFLNAPQDETVYAMWIGTNDLGDEALLTDSQVPGTSIVSYTDCVFNQLQRLYDSGARYFVVFNAAPLNLAPLYGLPGKKGKVVSPYWPDKPSNTTEISYRMMEQIVTVNAIYQYRTPFVAEVGKTFNGAKFAVFDVHSLMTNIYNNPSGYLNGTAPLNVAVPVRDCTPEVCITHESPDSHMWWDDLHPSEQTQRVIAREFVSVIEGKSQYASYWG
ncbi:uncharacterized protein ALTATR162_LOCUS10923 [Alternaria atra]|uniref:Carbohydrate esterase family 16 protein n=1 Tax=Alternaria atra TaxID=119953 RepID=A0A8J2IAD7_9PLEO|nr:uncharacterized protein ALTATR162_LOCUS10923 [Alternaria atra]CAG5184125.1 unnamed protein product [Alternaria atra]